MSFSRSNYIIKNDGTVWSCGFNQYGQLLLEDTVNRSEFTHVDMSDIKTVWGEDSRVLVLKNDGTLWARGYNGSGQLGLGDTTNRSTLTQINVSDIHDVISGYSHTFILKNDGTVWSCGYNGYGALGLSNTTAKSKFTQVNISDVKRIICGGYYTFILKNDGTVWACGQNTNGQLGLGDTTNRSTFTKVDLSDVKDIACAGYHSVILKNDGTVWSCGRNTYGQLGLGDTTNRNIFTKVDIDNVKYISCGISHTLAINNDGILWGCGFNGTGQLGLGDNVNRSIFTQVDISDISQILCGDYYTFILKNDDTLWSCGDNNYGQLGLGDITKRAVFTKINIDNISCLINSSITMGILPRYELIDIMAKSVITNSGTKYLITLPYRCRVFKYTSSSNVNIYYTMDNTLTINSDINEWTLDKSYNSTQSETFELETPYICTQLLVETDNIDDLEIWAEYDDGSISIGKIVNENLQELSSDIKNNLYIDENKYMYMNDIHGNYHRINGLYKDVLFEGSISGTQTYDLNDTFKYLIIESTDSTYSFTDLIYTDGSITCNHLDGSFVISISDNTLNIESISGLTITKIIGLS